MCDFVTWEKYPNYLFSKEGQIKHMNSDKILGSVQKLGYVSVTLNNSEGKQECKYIHRLVWECFVDSPDGYDIDHIDNNRGNNSLVNLQKISHKENIIKSIPNRDYSFTKNTHNAVTTIKAICEDGNEKTYSSMYKAHKELGINTGLIKMAIEGKNRCKGGYSKIDNKHYTFQKISVSKREKTFDPIKYQKERYANKIKIYCECGGQYTDVQKKVHFNTKKHKNYLSLH